MLTSDFRDLDAAVADGNARAALAKGSPLNAGMLSSDAAVSEAVDVLPDWEPEGPGAG